MAPNSTSEYIFTAQQTRNAGFTLNPSPGSLVQVQLVTLTCRTHLGSSIGVSQQGANPTSEGTVWYRRVEDPGEKTFGGFLGTFSAGFHECAIGGRAGCSVDDPTSLSLTIEASFADSMPGTSSKRIIQTVSIHYPAWPALNELSHCGQLICTSYNTNFSGREVSIIRTIRNTLTRNELPQDVSYDMEVHRARRSDSYGRVLSRRLTLH
ncbi:hypothetical protein BS47DRAFT_401667 [Hydnum rufescens UP504]|uniref:Uncharacterized protein n=1 Tax=Hydnum rufescens UP504 TaxID=1448309 RepID=A0A9P6BAX0_9AGAM|nr:hypothetical protein BS47DRAFT_401667 [Hydnum rufescens UP504]